MTKNTHKANIIKDNPAKDKDNQMSHFFLATDFHFHPHHTLSKSFCKQSTLTESQEQALLSVSWSTTTHNTGRL